MAGADVLGQVGQRAEVECQVGRGEEGPEAVPVGGYVDCGEVVFGGACVVLVGG